MWTMEETHRLWNCDTNSCFCPSWFHGDPLPLHDVPGLWDHVPCLHPAPIHPQQQTAGQWSPAGTKLGRRHSPTPTMSVGRPPAQCWLSWYWPMDQMEALALGLGEPLYHGHIIWNLEARGWGGHWGVVCLFGTLTTILASSYPNSLQRSSLVLWKRRVN